MYVEKLSTFLSGDKGLSPLIVCGSPGYFSKKIISQGLSCVSIETLKNTSSILDDIKSIFTIISLIRRYTPNLVVLNSGKASFLGRIACSLASTKCIYVVHGWSYIGWRRKPVRILYYFLEAIACAFFPSSFIFVSDFDKRHSPPFLRNANALTIHNGSSTAVQKSCGADLGILLEHGHHASRDKPRPFVFLSVCRLDSQKDVASLIRAFSLLSENSLLVIVGSGPQENNLRRLSRRIGISDRIVFTGRVPSSRVTVFYSLADSFILCSNWEGFPFVIVEAMHHSLPVLVSDVGGCCEVFNHDLPLGYTWGRINNPRLIARAMQVYIEKPLLARLHGRNARIVANSYYSDSAMLDKTYDFMASQFEYTSNLPNLSVRV
jgi:glycosyltransferase involved in cell wall biosynthesis